MRQPDGPVFRTATLLGLLPAILLAASAAASDQELTQIQAPGYRVISSLETTLSKSVAPSALETRIYNNHPGSNQCASSMRRKERYPWRKQHCA
jgi:hypothetical protein